MSRLHTAIVSVLVVSLLAGSTVGVTAQSGDEVSTSAGVNADTVDGKDAVNSGASKQQRAGSLVATNNQGLLPSNILKPLWGLIKGIPAVLADGLVAFDEIAGMPAPFADGQIAFGEVTGTPAGFADGVDDEGVTGVKVTRVEGPKSAPQADGFTSASANCPEGSLIVGGGAAIDAGNNANAIHFLSSQPGGSRNWYAQAWKQLGSSGTYQVQAFAICLSIEPAGNLSLAGKVTRAATKKGR